MVAPKVVNRHTADVLYTVSQQYCITLQPPAVAQSDLLTHKLPQHQLRMPKLYKLDVNRSNYATTVTVIAEQCSLAVQRSTKPL